jgi:hypothetical protein
MLGGLPLALNEIATYIKQQKITLDEFLPLYKRHQKRIHGIRPSAFDHTFTIATLWKMALEKLTGDAAILLRLVAFLDPDVIDEAMLQSGASGLEAIGICPELFFISDDLE